MRRIGLHLSIAGGLHNSLEKARSLGCDTVQIFSHNPRGWTVQERRPEEINAFRRLRTDYSISPVYIHTSYLVNLASSNSALLEKSVAMVRYEMETADLIGADYVVLHTGSASGDDPVRARSRVAAALSAVAGGGHWRAGLLLENTAGERGDITSKIEDLAEIIRSSPDGLVAGICMDTCHAHAAGYDISTETGFKALADEIERFVGLDRLRLIHLNDSKGLHASGRDRHEHIGEGSIGISGIKRVLTYPAFRNIPLILETPKKTEEDDARNLLTVRKLLAQV